MSDPRYLPGRRLDSLAALQALRPHVQAMKVQWGDMDALGHVNNVVYFQYLENMRIAMMEGLGIFPRLFHEGGGLVVADSRCRYKAPVVYPDTLHVGIGVQMLGEDRFLLHYDLFSERLQRVAAEAEVVIVSINAASGRKQPMPDWFRDAMAALA